VSRRKNSHEEEKIHKAIYIFQIFSLNPPLSFTKICQVFFIFKNILDKVNGGRYVFFEKKECIFRIFRSIFCLLEVI